MTFASFFKDKTLVILSAFMLAILAGGTGFFVYYYFIKDAAYLTYDKPQEIDVAHLDKMEWDNKPVYATLYNFCIDETTMEYHVTENSKTTIEAYYVFINNHCDSINGPLIIAEFDVETFEEFSQETDENQILLKFFSGKLYKGYHGEEASFFQFNNFLGKGNIYTLIAGRTPDEQKRKNGTSALITLLITVAGLVGFSLVIISHNSQVKKARLKWEQLEALKNNKPPAPKDEGHTPSPPRM